MPVVVLVVYDVDVNRMDCIFAAAVFLTLLFIEKISAISATFPLLQGVSQSLRHSR